MPNRVERWLGAAFLYLFAAQAAVAGPLLGDTAALISGSTPFSGTNGLGLPLTRFILADVEWAVYAPGAFSTSPAAHLNFPADISGGAEYIYAYEVFNTGSLSTDARITALSVGLFEDGVADNATLISHLLDPQDPPGQVPSSFNFNPAASGSPKVNAFWGFSLTTNAIALGDHSDILIFASPHAPDFKTSSILGEFATGASAMLPSPLVPEPGTVVLAAMAALGLLAYGCLRRQRR